MENDNIIQLIVFILIGVGYAVVAVIKKMDKWIQVHRMPQPRAPEQGPPLPRPGQPHPPAERDQRKNLATTLMEELQKALVEARGEPEAPPPPVAPPPPPGRAPAASYASEPRGATQSAATSHRKRRNVAGIRQTRTGERITASGIRMMEAASVERARLGHLAVLRSAADIRNGIVLHEILGPPRALRPFRPPSRPETQFSRVD